MNTNHEWQKHEQHGWTVCADCGAIQQYPHGPCDLDKKSTRLFARLEGKFDKKHDGWDKQ